MKNNSFPLRMHESPLRALRAKVDDTSLLEKQMNGANGCTFKIATENFGKNVDTSKLEAPITPEQKTKKGQKKSINKGKEMSEDSFGSKSPKKFRSITDINETCQMAFTEPRKCDESSQYKKQRAAIKEETKTTCTRQSWKSMENPKDKKVIGAKWIHNKVNRNDTINKHKTKLIAKRHAQEARVVYNKHKAK
ncbi:hypothetical protein ACJIZ3_025210 [Penstemon smallii]|uniref:Uncharacterized protein n=1 Tax=Penstemon smallii TaxID=265156 RepID=A0ABD3TU31_9LAMI